MSEKKEFAYRLADFLYRKLAKINKAINRALIELSFLKYKIDFGERDDDLYIISYPKSGTTLMQMILYQLSTDGNMDFEHIDEISPWIRNEAFKNKHPLDLPSPRIIKSHDTYEKFDFSVKGRFIYVYRNVVDVAISKYHQEKNYNQPDLELHSYIQDFFKKGNYNWFTYHKQWIENKKNAQILYVRYEDLLNNFDESLEIIIKFCNFDTNKIDRERVRLRSSFEFMKEHEDKFGVKPPKKQTVYNEFIRKGKAGEGKKQLTADELKTFEENFNTHIRPLFLKKN